MKINYEREHSIKKGHILVVSQYFYPEEFRINDICKEWVKRGYKVTVLAGIPNYPKGRYFNGYSLNKNRQEIWNGVHIIRIPVVPRRNNSLMLILNYLSYVASGFIWNVSANLKADYVFIYEVSPITLALPGVWYASKRKIPCCIYVTDLWPESVEAVTGIHNKQLLGSIGKMVDYIYRKCDRIFTSSESFIYAIHKRGETLSKLIFWPQYAEDFYRPVRKEMSEIPQDGVFNIIFAGNIGFAQGLDVLIRCANILKRSHIKVRFNIVGDGRYKEFFISKVRKNHFDDYFNFIHKKPPEEIPYYMGNCDAALICLSKNPIFSITIPAKTQSCLACGIPILVSADGEVQQIIKAAGCGLSSNAMDAKGLAQNIAVMSQLPKSELSKMAVSAMQYSIRYFNKEKLLSDMDRYLKEV